MLTLPSETHSIAEQTPIVASKVQQCLPGPDKMAAVAYEVIELLVSDDDPEPQSAESAPNTPTAVLLLGLPGPAAAAGTNAGEQALVRVTGL